MTGGPGVPGAEPGAAADVEVTVDLVGALLDRQHPDLAALPRSVVAQGWDNVSVRVGDELVARLPRRRMGADLLDRERRVLEDTADRLPLPVPRPVRSGLPAPDLGYPYLWSVVPWIRGRVAADAEHVDGARSADLLGRFLAALHRPAPSGVADNPYRSGPSHVRADKVTERLARVSSVAPEVAERLAREVAAARGSWAGPPVWVHGDLHPRNLLVDGDGVLCGVLDFGDTHAGEPAVDLAAVWLLLDRVHHAAVRDHLDVDDATWRRGRAWGVHLGSILAMQVQDPPFARVGLDALDRVLADLDEG